MTDWNKLKVPELKVELKTRGLSQNGLKAALVARLDEADNEISTGTKVESAKESDGNESIESNTVDNSPKADTEASQPQTEIDGASKLLIEPSAQDEVKKDAHNEMDTELAAPTDTEIDGASKLLIEPSAQDEVKKDAHNEMDTELAAPTETELFPTPQETPTEDKPLTESLPVEAETPQDMESRKRRSLSPPISSETSRKRQRKDTELPFADVEGKQDVAVSEGDAQWVERHNNVDTAIINSESKEIPNTGGRENSPTIVDVGKEEVVVEHAYAPRQDSAERSFERPVEDIDTRIADRNYRSPSARSNRQSEDHQTRRDYDMPDAEQERSVAPSIHPATSALYIRNFQRPLNRSELKDYVTELATAPGQSPDPEVVFDFFLDSICTHAFISFSNTSAASRVRSELHDRIWPDERTRQPLWADFIPYEKVREWIETEVSSTAARSGKKWEINYGIDDDGNVTATLQETGEVPAQIRTQSSGNINPGIVPGAPSGPRADIRRRDDGMHFDGHSDRYNGNTGPGYNTYNHPHERNPPVAQFDQDMIYTKTTPPVSFVPVSITLAEQRLDNIHNLYSKDAEDDYRAKSDQHRYSFEGDMLVDRGPEIFPGVRPPPGVRRRGLPRGLLGRGGRGPRGGGPRDFGRDDGRGHRGYRDDGYTGYRNDRPSRGGREPYNSGYDRGDRYDRPHGRYNDDSGRGRGYRGGYNREEPHWRGGGMAMGRR